jgi:histidyl-tRNA synthetase
LFRAERPQKGRLREFFQWNIDIIGVDDVLADAETIFCALDYLQEVGLTPDDIVVKISSREMLAAVLQAIGIAESKLDALYAVLDKRNKLPDEAFGEMLEKQLPDTTKRQKVLELMNAESIKEIESMFGRQEAFDELVNLMHYLNRMGVGDYYRFDPSIVRGLAYYTGIVYEIYDKATELRAIGGGGRYDDLLKQFGGPDIPATGFGIGDCVLEILLKEKGLLEVQLPKKGLDFFVAYVPSIVAFEDEHKSTPLEVAAWLAGKLREKNYRVDLSYKFTSLAKQLKEAATRNTQKCIIIGDEFKNNQLVVKDMTTGQQKTIEVDKFFTELKS